jgi:hypothetical protein
LVCTMHKICKVCGSNSGHHKRKRSCTEKKKKEKKLIKILIAMA